MEKRIERSRIIKAIAKWMRQWKKSITSGIAFFLFFSIFIFAVVKISHDGRHNIISNVPNITDAQDPPDVDDRLVDSSCQIDLDCTVRCQGVVDESISDVVNNLNFSGCDSISEINLYIEDAYFTNNTISEGWLKGLSKDVVELTIASRQLTDLGESAFAGHPFDYLNRLVIEDSKIRVLKRVSFLNSKLQIFEFRCTNMVTMEYDALGPISDYLVVFQLSRCIEDIVSVKNVTGTGTTVFNKLIELDLRYNTFNKVLNNTFIGTPQLVSLYLIDNNIYNVEVNAFKGIQTSLQLLSLKNNKLATLPDGIFNGFTRGGQIDISGNPWNCNCSLQWFKEFYVDNLEFYFKNGTIPFTCTAGNYSDVDFCPDIPASSTNGYTEDTAKTTATTPTTALTSTTVDPVDYIYLECKDLTLQDQVLKGVNKIYSHSVKVRHGNITYSFYQLEYTPNFEIKILNSIGSDYVIWINSKNSSDYGCVHNVQETVQLDNLKYGMSYTICLLKESMDTVTPFDCTSLNVPLEWRNLPWIENKDIAIVVGGILGTTFVIILITSLIIFYTIRQNPKLIKGNKRVVIVRNKSADALVMPNYEIQPYIPPSIYTNSAGYLTPRNKMYDKINERRFRHLNTITEKFYRDMYNESRSLYEPQSFHRRSVGSALYEAPPLPPNHPSERAKASRPQSSFYKR